MGQHRVHLSDPHNASLSRTCPYCVSKKHGLPKMVDSLSLLDTRALLPMFHNNIDKQSRFRESQTGDALEVAKHKGAGRFFFAGRLLASASRLVSAHDRAGVNF